MDNFGRSTLTKEERQEKAEQVVREKQAREKEQKRHQLNRQINYFVMRRMWQVIHGRSADDTIYIALDMSRERFTRIINTGIVRYKKEEINFLTKQTGLSREIFTGEERFICRAKKGAERETITQEEWSRLFSLRAKRKELKDAREGDDEIPSAEEDAANEEYKKSEGDIYEKLQEATRGGDTQFHKLCTYLKSGYGAKEERLKELRQALGFVGAIVLNDCNEAELKDLVGLLRKKLEIVNATLIYKGANDLFEKN